MKEKYTDGFYRREFRSDPDDFQAMPEVYPTPMVPPKSPRNPDPTQLVAEDESIVSDVEGSYTGNPVDGVEPVQDADDL